MNLTGSSDQRTVGLRVLAVDDEPPALDDLLHLLRSDPRIARADGVTNANEALRYVHQTFDDDDLLDAVFLDLRMPGLNGMDLARVLVRFAHPPSVVFVTAYDNHAVEAFEVKALDYLLKPVRVDRLREAIDRIVSRRDKPSATERAATPAASEVAEAPLDPDAEKVPVELGGVTRFIRLADIRHIEAQGDYARLYTPSGNFLIRTAMSTLESRWAVAGFMRIHRRFLVATRYIEELALDNGQLTVRVGVHALPVSRRHASQVRDRLVSQARPTARRLPVQ
jgi:DNA-binding LytR/AlgR family response regulator